MRCGGQFYAHRHKLTGDYLCGLGHHTSPVAVAAQGGTAAGCPFDVPPPTTTPCGARLHRRKGEPFMGDWVASCEAGHSITGRQLAAWSAMGGWRAVFCSVIVPYTPAVDEQAQRYLDLCGLA
jgi:hypothetical protein